MNALNLTIKADWIERIDKLNPEQRQLTVMAIYDYMVYGKLSKNEYVNFAISWIRDEIDSMKQARERREARRRARMEEKQRVAEEQKSVSEEQNTVPEEQGTVTEERDVPVTEPAEPEVTMPVKSGPTAKINPQSRGVAAKPHRQPQSLNFRDFKRQKKLTAWQVPRRCPPARPRGCKG